MLTRHVSGIDLNLLKVDALLNARSVTLAAEQLGIGQPAASRALARLRKVLDDPLLVRGPGGYQLSPRAHQLHASVTSTLRELDQVFAPASFDPSTTTRHFRITTTDYGSLAVLNHAVPTLLRASPLARLEVLPWSESTLSALAEGDIDLALYADEPLPAAYSYRRLFRETFSCLYRRGHPIGQRARTGSAAARLKALGSYQQAVIAYPSGRVTQNDDLFEKMRLPRERIALSLPYFLAAPWIILDSDLVLVVPTRVASFLAALANLESVPFPASAAGFEYRMVWHERMHRDLANRWLRATVLEGLAANDSVGRVR